VWFLAYFGMRNANDLAVYESNSGMKYKVSVADAGFLSKKLSPPPPGFAINDGDTVFDIGANVGIFSIFAATQAKNVKVYSFEPLPDNFKLLKENISTNHIGNIVAINKAVSGKSGLRELSISPAGKGGNTLQFNKDTNGDWEKVQVHTIAMAEFIAQNSIAGIDFLKMDCEGSEYEILLNLPPQIFKKIRKISMEWHDLDGKTDPQSLVKLLEEQGYAVRIEHSDDRRFGMMYANKP
jgi:FkbM family methyltransferase